MSTTTTDRATARPTTRRGRRWAAVTGATGAALLVWLLAVPLLGVELTTTIGPQGAAVPVGVAGVGFAGLLGGFAAWGLLALLERFTTRAPTVWTVVALTVLVLSLTGPLTLATSAAAAVVLVTMHVAVAAVLVAVLGPTARSQ